MVEHPITVGIMGGSAPGKTTFTAALTEELTNYSLITLHQDSYFRDWSEFSAEEREKVMVEGHLIFWNQKLRELIDMKIYLDVDAHERVLRRILRDVGRHGDLERVVNWYRRDVIPNFPVYTESCKQYADIIIPYMTANPVALHNVASGIRSMC